jgi:hypothetical protein
MDGKDMDCKIKGMILEFLNVLLGSKCTDNAIFWEQILLPKVALYFKFPLEELIQLYRKDNKDLIYKNALYFAFCHAFGMEI